MAVVRQRLSEQAAIAALNGLSQYPIVRYDFASLSMRTLQLSGEHQRSAYDSAYLALAESQGVWFFTGDKRLFNAVRQSLAWVKWIGDYRFDDIPIQATSLR